MCPKFPLVNRSISSCLTFIHSFSDSLFPDFLIQESKQPQWNRISFSGFNHICCSKTIFPKRLGILASNYKFIPVLHPKIEQFCRFYSVLLTHLIVEKGGTQIFVVDIIRRNNMQQVGILKINHFRFLQLTIVPVFKKKIDQPGIFQITEVIENRCPGCFDVCAYFADVGRKRNLCPD